MGYYKKVLLPITVPEGKYCWGGRDHRTCEHFDNERGYPTCEIIPFVDLKYDRKSGYVEKPDKCRLLQAAPNK